MPHKTNYKFSFIILMSSVGFNPQILFADSEIKANIALSSDYVWRGYSQTDEDAAISGGFDYNHSDGFYVGIWGSNVGFAEDADLELDFYTGYAFKTESGVELDIGILRYSYPGTSSSGDLDWNEYHLSATYGITTATINFSNDTYGSAESSLYYTIAVNYTLSNQYSLAAGIGIYDYDDSVVTDSVQDFHIGISKKFSGLSIDLSYYDTNSAGSDFYGDKVADSRLVLSVSKSL